MAKSGSLSWSPALPAQLQLRIFLCMSTHVRTTQSPPKQKSLILAVSAPTRNLQPAFLIFTCYLAGDQKCCTGKTAKYLNLHIDFPGQVESSFFLKKEGCSPFSDYPEVGVMVQAFVQRF